MTHRCPIKLDQFDVMLGHQTDATSTTIAILTKFLRTGKLGLGLGWLRENMTGAACGLTLATVSPQAAPVIVVFVVLKKNRKNDIFFFGGGASAFPAGGAGALPANLAGGEENFFDFLQFH